MAHGMEWEELRCETRVLEPAPPERSDAKEPRTHVKRQPVRVYTAEEITAWKHAGRCEDSANGSTAAQPAPNAVEAYRRGIQLRRNCRAL